MFYEKLLIKKCNKRICCFNLTHWFQEPWDESSHNGLRHIICFSVQWGCKNYANKNGWYFASEISNAFYTKESKIWISSSYFKQLFKALSDQQDLNNRMYFSSCNQKEVWKEKYLELHFNKIKLGYLFLCSPIITPSIFVRLLINSGDQQDKLTLPWTPTFMWKLQIITIGTPWGQANTASAPVGLRTNMYALIYKTSNEYCEENWYDDFLSWELDMHHWKYNEPGRMVQYVWMRCNDSLVLLSYPLLSLPNIKSVLVYLNPETLVAMHFETDHGYCAIWDIRSKLILNSNLPKSLSSITTVPVV